MRPMIFKGEDGLWYFWDEAGVERHGPYLSFGAAKSALDDYCDWLGVPVCNRRPLGPEEDGT